MERERVLLVEDEQTLREMIQLALEDDGFDVAPASSAEEGLSLFESSTWSVAVLDIVLPGMNGMQLLERIRRLSPDTEVIIMTSHASVETAIKAIRQGAYDYVEKPFDDIEEIALRVRKAVDRRSLAIGNRRLLKELRDRYEDLRKAHEALTTTQEQLVRSERVKAVGQMAAGVAHDFNNALSGIMGKAQLLKLRAAAGEAGPGEIDVELEAIIRLSVQAAETIKRVQNFTQQKPAPEAALDINSLIREAVNMTRPKWGAQCDAEGRRIEISYELGEAGVARGNAVEITQVISNLIFNAVEAMPGGGVLTFRSSVEGDWVVVEVADTGHGMDDATRSRLFEPFFTTKEDGQGLGTSIIHGIIARHGGEIAVSSVEGEGSSFRIKLPRHDSDAPLQAPDPQPSRAAAVRSARILFVEDDPVARATYTEILHRGGHTVVAAASAVEAVERFDEGGFDLIITDLNMPGMTGLDMTRRIRSRGSGIPIILLTGWIIEEEADPIRSAGVEVLAKPCLAEDLHRAVERALGGGPGARRAAGSQAG